jgi:hypothetical protein
MQTRSGFFGGVALAAVYMCPMWAFGQSLSASVGVGGGVGSSSTTLCQQFSNDTTGPITGSCLGYSWDAGAGDFGAGGATATADYGVLQSYASASTTMTTAAIEAAGTASTTAVVFSDTLTFPSLSSNAFLKATLTVLGSASANQASSANANVNLLSDGQFQQCTVSAFTANCTTSIPVSPGDQVSVDGHLQTNASTNIPANSTGSESATLNYSTRKSYGARCAFVLVDASGKTMSGTKIVAASGTKYPTH